MILKHTTFAQRTTDTSICQIIKAGKCLGDGHLLPIICTMLGSAIDPQIKGGTSLHIARDYIHHEHRHHCQHRPVVGDCTSNTDHDDKRSLADLLFEYAPWQASRLSEPGFEAMSSTKLRRRARVLSSIFGSCAAFIPSMKGEWGLRASAPTASVTRPTLPMRVMQRIS